MSDRQPNATQGWQQMLGVIIVAQFVTAIGFSSFFPFLPFYVNDLGSAHGLNLDLLAGLAYSGQALTMALISPVWGTLADRFGRKLMVERATFGGAGILLLMAFARSAEDLVILRAIQGLVTGTVAAANALVAASVPRERIGYAMGMLQVALGAGIAFGPFVGGAIADAYGYQATFYATAGLLLIAGLLVRWYVHENFEPKVDGSPSTSGLLNSWRGVVDQRGVVAVYSLRFLSQLGRNVLLPVTPVFIQLLMVSPERLNTMTGLVTGLAAGSATISAVYLGRLGDRVGHMKVLLLCNAASLVLYIAHYPVSNVWQLLILQVLLGIPLGGIIPAISALLAQTTGKAQAGAVYGLDNSITSGGRALAPLLGAAVIVWFDVRVTFFVVALIFLVASLLVASLRRRFALGFSELAG